jgi:hypothetical protein
VTLNKFIVKSTSIVTRRGNVLFSLLSDNCRRVSEETPNMSQYNNYAYSYSSMYAYIERRLFSCFFRRYAFILCSLHIRTRVWNTHVYAHSVNFFHLQQLLEVLGYISIFMLSDFTYYWMSPHTCYCTRRWTVLIDNAFFLNKIGSGRQRVAQNSVGDGEVLVTPISGKKLFRNAVPASVLLRNNFRNAVPACVLLRNNFRNGVPARSVT